MHKNSNIDNIYFTLSGIFAIVLYILLILFLVFILRIDNKTKISINSPSKVNTLSVNLVDEIVEPIKEIPQTQKPTQNLNKDKGSKTPVTGLGAGNLFEKIDTKNPNPKKDIKLSDDRDKIALNKKSLNNENEVKNKEINEIIEQTSKIMQTLENINQNIAISDSNTSRFCYNNKDYCNKLAELLYSNWHMKSHFDNTLSSIVEIRISKEGNFSYNIKRKSGNENFDSELEESLEKLKNVKFPILENINLDKLEVIFKNKKENK